ncbi:MAG: hypothetical protein MMC23_004985 [Stictis urceolatum]|nr:hypothetical protein [Stictis urceolata]
MAGIYGFQVQPQYASAKHGIVGLVRSTGPKLLRDESISLNAVLPAFVATGLAPDGLIDVVRMAGHLTPMRTVINAFALLLEETIGKECYGRIDDNDDSKREGLEQPRAVLSGERIEASLDYIYLRKQVRFANESQRSLIEDPKGWWSGAYEGKRRTKGSQPHNPGPCASAMVDADEVKNVFNYA